LRKVVHCNKRVATIEEMKITLMNKKYFIKKGKAIVNANIKIDLFFRKPFLNSLYCSQAQMCEF